MPDRIRLSLTRLSRRHVARLVDRSVVVVQIHDVEGVIGTSSVICKHPPSAHVRSRPCADEFGFDQRGVRHEVEADVEHRAGWAGLARHGDAAQRAGRCFDYAREFGADFAGLGFLLVQRIFGVEADVVDPVGVGSVDEDEDLVAFWVGDFDGAGSGSLRHDGGMVRCE